MNEAEQDRLFKKAQSLKGKWIYDTENDREYLYVRDCYRHDSDGDVMLECIAIGDEDRGYHPYITEKNVWMSEFKEFYCMVKGNKGQETWESIKTYYDGIFKVKE